MRKLLTTTAVMLALATPAFAADCMDEMDELGQRLSKGEKEYKAALDTKTRKELRELRDAARYLQEQDQEAACMEVVASIEEIIEEKAEAQQKGEQQGQAQQQQREQDQAKAEDQEQADRQQLEGYQEAARREQPAMTEQMTIDRQEGVQGAKQVTDMQQPFLVDEIEGADLVNMQDEDIGEISGVVLDPQTGEIQYAVVSYGGFLGVGDEEVAVPWERLRATEAFDIFVLDMTEAQLEQAPEIDRMNPGQLGDEEWRQEVENFYGQMQQGQQKGEKKG